MIILSWFILSLFGVCEFTWLPVFLEGIIVSTVFAMRVGTDADNGMAILRYTPTAGIASFAFYKFFAGLSLSFGWILLAPVWFVVSMIFPGGVTISNLLLQKFGLMDLPTWGMIVGVVVDVLFLAAEIYGGYMIIKGRQN